jgi:hypothetical protein
VFKYNLDQCTNTGPNSHNYSVSGFRGATITGGLPPYSIVPAQTSTTCTAGYTFTSLPALSISGSTITSSWGLRKTTDYLGLCQHASPEPQQVVVTFTITIVDANNVQSSDIVSTTFQIFDPTA